MKKLLTAAVASTFAFLAMGVVNGDEINQGADFEASDFESGEAFNAALDDEAGAYGDKFWYTEDTEADNVISNYPSIGTGVPIASRPDKFASRDNSKYLRVETTGKLWRTVKNNGGSDDFTTNVTATYAHSLADSAIYLDTLVKFTPADGEFAADALADGDKIAISYVEHEADTDGDVSYTNFVIRAGLIRGELFQTNYFAYLPDDPTFANFDKDAWHRLTVRTIPEVGTSENPGGVGFVVYVDETPLAYSADVDAGFGTLNATAQGFYDNTKHALFPSAVGSGSGKLTISAASFSGNGSLDDVVFTTTTPTFIANSESVPVTFTVPAGVTSITVDGGEVDLADPTTNLAANVTVFDLVVTVDSASGYTYAGISGAETNELGQVVVEKPAMEITILTSRNNVSYINDSDETVYCATLSEAFLNAKDGSTITLPYNNAPFTYTVADWEGNSFAGYETGFGEYVLDLNGNTIDGGDDSAGQPLIKVYGTLTIIDSRGGGEIIYDTTQASTGIVSLYGSDIYIGAATGDAGATFTGKLFENDDDGYIVKGYFDDAANGYSGAFLWDSRVDTDSTCSATPDANNYWVVTPQGSGDEDWATGTDLDDLEGQKVSDIYSGISADFDKVDAKTFVTWASGVGDVAYADKGSTTFNIDCFLLNIANDSTPAAIAAATATAEEAIKITAITFDASGNPAITAPASYGNGVVVIEGSVSLDPISWHEKDDGDHFFHAKLVVDEVVTP